MKRRMLEASGIRSKILIVEDDALMTAVYKRLFLREEDRFTCTLVRSAEDALHFLSFGRADILILDWDLPGISGLDVLDQDLAEDVRPGVVLRDPHPRLCRSRQCRAITLALRNSRQ